MGSKQIRRKRDILRQGHKPYVPEGEWGTWCLWEIEEQGAKLIRGNKIELDVIREKRKKDVMKLQKVLMRSSNL